MIVKKRQFLLSYRLNFLFGFFKEREMATFKQIDVQGAKEHLQLDNVKLVDIRDENAYERDHVEGSFHLTNDTLAEFIEEVAFTDTVLVLCYHGNSSKGVAQYLCEQGYLDVYSVDGGFANWQTD